jgi:hypothetical protein
MGHSELLVSWLMCNIKIVVIKCSVTVMICQYFEVVK